MKKIIYILTRAMNITKRFPQYTVQFDGIGKGPEGTEHLGCCSQLAVFIRKDVICDNYIKETKKCTCIYGSTCCNSAASNVCSCECADCLPIYSHGICTYNTYSEGMLPSFDSETNSFYSQIAAVDYPFEIDTRTEEDKLLAELVYRMHFLGSENGRFFLYEKGYSEIPLKELMYGDLAKTHSELEIR